MRYLLSLFLVFACLLSGTAQTEQYVWAPSGLSLRTAGYTEAEKIGVIPYGEAVELTGKLGNAISLPVFKAFKTELYGDEIQSHNWDLTDAYVEVIYNGKTGWIFAGYLFRLPPPKAGDIPNIFSWLETVAGTPDTLLTIEMSEISFQNRTITQYAHGITCTSEYGEGGGETTWSFPLGSLNDGYLISEVFFNLSEQVDTASGEEWSEHMLLQEVNEHLLEFAGEMSGITVQIVGGLLLVNSWGGC